MESYIKFMANEWNEFIKTGDISHKVKREIADSWRRCKGYKVNPMSGKGLDTEKLSIRAITEKNKELMSVAKPIMENIYSIVKGSGFAIFLTDRDGYIIDIIGDKEILEEANNLNFKRGALWCERTVGTNAIGTAIYLNKPIQTVGAEHFGLDQHSWTCSAAPIHDDTGNIIGCIDMSGYCNSVHSHTLGMVTAAAQSIGILIKFKNKNYRINNKNITKNKALYNFDDIITEDKAMIEMISLAKKAAKSECNILIEGESGTGKELIAQSIHNCSNRVSEPFIAINCGAIPRELVESELFGYEGGAFTGASKDGKIGKFELADKGTIFLDELGELPLDIQTKLLRVLDSGRVSRIGSEFERQLDIRVVGATNRVLKNEIKKKNFRDDLYYRINVINIKTVPLRERNNDVGVLARYFIKELNSKNNSYIRHISNSYINELKKYDWPGNVRELKNVIERDYYLSDNDLIEEHNNLEIEKSETKNRERSRKLNIIPMNVAEKKIIKNALDKCDGNIVKVAKFLNMSRSTLYRKIKKYNINNDRK